MYVFIYFRTVRVTELLTIGKQLLNRLTTCSRSIVPYFHLGFKTENFFLLVPFPDHCLLVPHLTPFLYTFFVCVFYFSPQSIRQC